MITTELSGEKTFEEMNWFLAKLFADWTQYAASHLDQQDRIKMLIRFEELKEFMEVLEEKNESELFDQ